MDYIKENYEWLTPIIIAIIGGIFGLFKILFKKDKPTSQKANNIKNSKVNQVGGNQTNIRNEK